MMKFVQNRKYKTLKGYTVNMRSSDILVGLKQNGFQFNNTGSSGNFEKDFN